MEYTVVIRKRNCFGFEYNNPYGCPLAMAILEQLPLLQFNIVGSYYVMIDRKEWKFKEFMSLKGWSSKIMDEIMSGKIKEYSVTFTSPNHLEELAEVNVEEVKTIINRKTKSYV